MAVTVVSIAGCQQSPYPVIRNRRGDLTRMMSKTSERPKSHPVPGAATGEIRDLGPKQT
jgi:hypothetical protein